MRPSIPATAATLALAFATSALAAPNITAIHPIGFERGKTVTLSIHGQGLAGEIEVLSSVPGTTAAKPIETVDGKPAYNPDQRRDFDLQIAPDAPVGIYPIRVRTPDGISNQVLFSVGLLQDVGEVEPNDRNNQAQPIELGQTILGAVQPADRDIYKLNLPAGARVVAEVESRRLGLPMDAFLQLIDADGREIVSNDDAMGLGSDSRIDATLAKSGDYYLLVHDVTFQNNSAYRLKVGNFPYAEAIYPLGGPRAPETQIWPVTPSGTNADVTTISTQNAASWTMVQPMDEPTAALPFRFIVGSGDEILEADQPPTPIADNQTANGRLLHPDETDLYHVAVQPGQRWRFQLVAASLGSPLDAVMSLLDAAGTVLATADDAAGLDPTIDFTVPDAQTELIIQIKDLLGRGGPAFAYRLQARLLPPADFSVTVLNDVLNVPVGSTELVQVKLDRRGYNGPVQLFIPESVTAVRAEAGRIEAGKNEGYILLSALPGHAPGRTQLEIWARGGSASKPMDRKVTGSPANMVPYVDASLIDPMPAAICRAKPIKCSIASNDITIVHGYSNKLDIAIERTENATEAVRITPRVRASNYPNGTETTIPKGQNAGSIEFPGGTEVPLGQDLIVFEAISNVDGSEVRTTLPPVRVRVVRPFAIEVFTKQITIPTSGSANIDLLIRRVPPFDQPVLVRVDDLPKGVSCEPVTLATAESIARLTVTATDAPAGQFTLKVIPAADIPGRKRDKDYVLPPTEVKLTISPPDPESKQ